MVPVQRARSLVSCGLCLCKYENVLAADEHFYNFTILSRSKIVVIKCVAFPSLPQFAAICRNLPLQVRMLGSVTYVNVHSSDKNTQFAVFCILPASKEKAVTLIVSPPHSIMVKDHLFVPSSHHREPNYL